MSAETSEPYCVVRCKGGHTLVPTRWTVNKVDAVVASCIDWESARSAQRLLGAYDDGTDERRA